jgi:hypothetical protein
MSTITTKDGTRIFVEVRKTAYQVRASVDVLRSLLAIVLGVWVVGTAAADDGLRQAGGPLRPVPPLDSELHGRR